CLPAATTRQGNFGDPDVINLLITLLISSVGSDAQSASIDAFAYWHSPSSSSPQRRTRSLLRCRTIGRRSFSRRRSAPLISFRRAVARRISSRRRLPLQPLSSRAVGRRSLSQRRSAPLIFRRVVGRRSLS